jgi:hypothetical protein
MQYFLLQMSEDLAVQAVREVLMPTEVTEAGFSDPRLFAWEEALWCCLSPPPAATDGESEQMLVRLDGHVFDPNRSTNWRMLRAQGHPRHWIPYVRPAVEEGENELRFVTGCDPTRVVDDRAYPIGETAPAIAADQFDGATPAIEFDPCPGQEKGRGWLALVHEAEMRDSERYDRHRWVWFDDAGVLRRVSPAFCLGGNGIERAAGIAAGPSGGDLLMSYGVGDEESWLATVTKRDVRKLLDDTERLSWDEPSEA